MLGEPNRTEDLENSGAQGPICATRVIDDVPAGRDAFGPHDRLAQTIAQLVKSEPGGKTIGLEGAWGRGKSTVVGLVGGHLRDAPACSMVVFDAWAHQGDPLRRSFLERVTKHLEGCGWIHAAKWNRRLEELARRRKVTDTNTSPRLTKTGKVLGALLLLVPVGIALLQAGLRVNSPFASPALWLGLATAAAPFALILTAAVVQRFAGTLDDEEPGSALWSLLVSRAVSVTHTESLETPEPTSVEFERIFLELMSDALSASERRLVLVLDNLDRVAASDALAIWSALQTFLQQGQSSKPPWHSRLWVLIPYDRGGIEHLWRRGGGDDQRDEDSAEDSGGIAGALAASFLDKSLQLRFEVPPPVLSRWDSYLRDDVLPQAFPDHRPEDFYDVARVFASARPRGHEPPTPRDIKLFVNQVGALHRQWQDELGLPCLAYYALLRTSGVDVAQGLLRGSLPIPDVMPLVGDRARESLAALWFNADRTIAQQLLLGPDIENAIASGDFEGLQLLRDVHGDGFWRVLEEWISSNKDRFATGSYVAAAATALEPLLKEDRYEARAIRRVIGEFKSSLRGITPFTGRIAAGVVALLHLIPADDDLHHAIRDGMKSSVGLRSQDQQDASRVTASEWAGSFLVVTRALREGGSTDTVDVDFGPHDWIQVAHVLREVEPSQECWEWLRPSCSAAEIEAVLAGEVTAGTLTSERAGAIPVTLVCLPGHDWSTLAANAFARLQGGTSAESGEIDALASALWYLREPPQSSQAVAARLVNEGHLFHHIHQAFADGHNSALAWCIMLITDVAAAFTAPPAVGSSQTGFAELSAFAADPSTRPAVVVALAERIPAERTEEMLLPLLDSGTATPLVTAVLRQMFSERRRPFLAATELIKRWRFLREDVFAGDGDQFGRILASYVQATNVLVELTAAPFDPGDSELYVLVLKVGGADNEGYGGWLTDGLERMESATWLQEFQRHGPVVELLAELEVAGRKFIGDAAFRDALVQFGDWLVVGNSCPPGVKERRATLCTSLRADGRELLRKDLLDAASGRDRNASADFFEFFGEELGEGLSLGAQPELVRRLFIPLLRNRNAAGLAWFATVVEHDPSLLEAGRDVAAANEFKRRLAQASTEDADDAAKAIQRLRQSLHVVAQANDESAETGPSDSP